MLPGQQQQPPSSSVIDWPRVCLRLFGSVSHFFFFFFRWVCCESMSSSPFWKYSNYFFDCNRIDGISLGGGKDKIGRKENKTKNNVKVEDIICDKRNESHTQTHTCLSLSPREWAKKKKRELSNEYHYANFLFFPLIFGIHDDVCAPPIDTRRTLKMHMPLR